MTYSVQQDLDRLLHATAAERAALARGRIPRSVVQRHQYLQAGPIERLVHTLRGQRHRPAPPALRAVHGQVFTRRTWNYSYGDVYELWSQILVVPAGVESLDLEEAAHGWLDLFGKLGERVLRGVATVYVVRFPTVRRGLAPHVDAVVAIEVAEGEARLEERPPAFPPPPEPFLSGQAADEGTLS